LQRFEKYLKSLPKKEKFLLYGIIFLGTPLFFYQTLFLDLENSLKEMEIKLKFRQTEIEKFSKNIPIDQNLIELNIQKKRDELLKLENRNLFLSEEMKKIPKKLSLSEAILYIYQKADEVGTQIIRADILESKIELVFISTFQNSLFFMNYFERKNIFKIENLKIEKSGEKVLTSLLIKLF
jgi:ABC-type Fe3+-citrate transport system substrate-binding protein